MAHSSLGAKLRRLGIAGCALIGLVGTVSGCLVPQPTAAPPCTSAQTGELLQNPGFEGTYTGSASNWGNNTWGSAKFIPSRADSSQGGASAQQVTFSGIDSSSGSIFEQSIRLTGGSTYQASIWMRSNTPTTVTFQLRRAAAPYESVATQRVRLGPNWAKYQIVGGPTETMQAFFGVSPSESATVQLENASLRQILPASCGWSSRQDLVSKTYFGMHVNKWGTYPSWPSSLGFGTVRLWDTGTTWADLEPAPGTWDWRRMDYYVDTALRAGEQLIYTLGAAPSWAIASDGAVDLQAWGDYVRTLALRYHGRISIWETWNEANENGSFRGSPTQMVTLTAAARSELKDVDPGNKLLSPSVTVNGMTWLDEYLQAGGASLVDGVAVHVYTGYTPEQYEGFFRGIHEVLDQRGVGSMPIWDTEGAVKGVAPSQAAAVGAMARNYVLQWIWGVSNFNWYAWDIDLGCGLSSTPYSTATPIGAAYRQLVGWLSGNRLWLVNRSSSGVWQIALQSPGGATRHLLWSSEGQQVASIPTAWGTRYVTSLTGGRANLGSMSAITVGPEPVLLSS